MTLSHLGSGIGRPRLRSDGEGEERMKALETRVNEIVAEQLGAEKDALVPEANLLDDLGADSLDVVELVMALEEEYGIEVTDEDAENIRTVQDIVTYIEARTENAA
jgi:acyl carrier protein